MEAHAIVLAAGAGRRFGGGKLTSMLGGRPLVVWSVAAALASRARTVTIVLGADANQVGSALVALECGRLRTVVCPAWSEGIAASLRCGIASLPRQADAALIFLGDMPCVSGTLADRLLAAVRDGAPAALPMWDGKPAHPVAISARLFGPCSALQGDKGARDLLRQVDGVVHIQVDDRGSADDVDTPEDLKTLELMLRADSQGRRC